jgi:Phage tail lysozyme
MQSIGELFVSLGFDVDDQKLKNFNDGIRNLSNDMLKFAGISSLSLAGLAYFMSGSANAATAMQNFNIQTGQSIDGLQKFIAVMRQTNPAETFESGLAAAKNLNTYLTEARMGQRSMMELNMLGFTPDHIPTEEETIRGLLKSFPQAYAKWGPQFASKWTEAIFGTAGAVPALLSGDNYDALGAKGMASQENLQALQDYNKQLSEIGVSWDALKMKITGDAAPAIVSALNWMTEAARSFSSQSKPGEKPEDKYDNYADYIDQEGIGAVLAHVLGRGFGAMGSAARFAAAGFQGHEAREKYYREQGFWWAEPAPPGSEAAAPADQGTPDFVQRFFQSKGWSKAQAEGMAARLMKESNLSPTAKGDNGQAYGVAQWHPDRQADFAAYAVKDIRQATLEEQLDFMNYELTRGKEKAAGDQLRQTTTPLGAEGITTGMYERPAITQNNTMYISGANAEEIGEEIMRQIVQKQTDAAYAQRNLGAQY